MNKLFALLILFAFSSKAQQVDTFRIAKSEAAIIKPGSVIVTFFGKSGGTITALEAANGCCLLLNLDNAWINTFTIVISEKERVNPFYMISNSLTDEVQKKLRKLKPGDKFIFEDIVAVDNKGLKHNLLPLVFTIVN